MNTITAVGDSLCTAKNFILGKKEFSSYVLLLPHTGQESSSTSKRQWVLYKYRRKLEEAKTDNQDRRLGLSTLPLPPNTQYHLHLRGAAPGKEERLRGGTERSL